MIQNIHRHTAAAHNQWCHLGQIRGSRHPEGCTDYHRFHHEMEQDLRHSLHRHLHVPDKHYSFGNNV